MPTITQQCSGTGQPANPRRGSGHRHRTISTCTECGRIMYIPPGDNPTMPVHTITYDTLENPPR